MVDKKKDSEQGSDVQTPSFAPEVQSVIDAEVKRLLDEAGKGVLFDEKFSARVNRDGDTTETILRQIDGVPTLVLYGKSSKFKSDKKYRITITEIAEPEPTPEQPKQ